MKPKVLFVATVLRGHMLVFHLPYMQWFQQQGYEVHCCAGNDTGEEPPTVPFCDRYIEIPFERNPVNSANRKAYHQLKTLIDQENYALIHCHTPVGGMLGRLAARDARKRGTRVCYTAHGFHFYIGAPLKYWFLYYTAERFLARYTDLLITINQEDYERARKFAAKKVTLVRGVGIDLTRFEESGDRQAIRAEIGVPPDAPMIITVGEHTERKNHAVCVRALAEVSEAMLVFCGVGRQLEMLKKLAKELGVEERIRFLGFRRDIPELLQAADIFIFPSRHEGLPVSLMEAMAAGLPCVVSGVRGNTDLIQDHEGGFVCAPDDTHGFATGLQALLENERLRKQFGERNRKEVQQYSLPSVRASTAVLYREQLGMRGEV